MFCLPILCTRYQGSLLNKNNYKLVPLALSNVYLCIICLMCINSNIGLYGLINAFELIKIEAILLSNKFIDLGNLLNVNDSFLCNYN